jgi:3'-5' exoribonuclease
MPRTFLSAANPGDYLEEVFVLTNKQLSTTQTGKPFIKCLIGDRTKQIPARMWNATQGIFNAMPDGGFLRVAGKVESYQDNLQFIIDRFWIADQPGEIVLEDLLPCSKRDIKAMFAELVAIMQTVKNRHLRALLDEYLNDEELMDQLRRSPAAMTFHHAFIGGLLEHTLNMLKVGDALCPFYPGISRDLVLAGIFLHDIAKTWELTYHAGFGYSDGGHLVGHIAKSAIWVELRAKSAEARIGEPIPAALVDVLQHLILSHHGQPEFGAAKLPATPEAILIHYIDNIDAKLTMSLGVTRQEGAAGEGNFTEYQKALGVRLFRPDVAFVAAEEPPVKNAMHVERSFFPGEEHAPEPEMGGKRSIHP